MAVGTRPDRREDERMPWLKPQLVWQFEYVEWTPDDHLRHSRFIGLGRIRTLVTYGGKSSRV